MRITLRWKITAILVVFGLVPASIVAWFAYNANDDYRKKQTLIVVKTAEAISFRVAAVLQQDAKIGQEALKGNLPDNEKRSIQEAISLELGRSGIPTAQVFIVTAEGRMLVWRHANQNFDPNVTNQAMDLRYVDLAKQAAAGNDFGYKFVEPGDDSGVKSELVSYAPTARRRFGRGQRRVAPPRDPDHSSSRSCLRGDPQEPDIHIGGIGDRRRGYRLASRDSFSPGGS